MAGTKPELSPSKTASVNSDRWTSRTYRWARSLLARSWERARRIWGFVLGRDIVLASPKRCTRRSSGQLKQLLSARECSKQGKQVCVQFDRSAWMKMVVLGPIVWFSIYTVRLARRPARDLRKMKRDKEKTSNSCSLSSRCSKRPLQRLKDFLVGKNLLNDTSAGTWTLNLHSN